MTKYDTYKKKLKEAGLKRVDVWIDPKDEKLVKQYDKRKQIKKEGK